MITKPIIFLLLLFTLTACFFQKPYKQSNFTYNSQGQSATIPLVVPKGFIKEEKVDTAGITLHTFYYPGGALLYAAFLADTTVALQPYDKTLHQPQVHRLGGWVYKGQDEKELYYREIQQGPLRFGYRLVAPAQEQRFDSATNFASLQQPVLLPKAIK